MTGNPYIDTLSVKVEDPKTVEIVAKKDGKVVGKERDVVSEDGNQFTSDWTWRTPFAPMQATQNRSA